MVTLRQLLEDMVQRKASDLHLCVGVPPEFRVDGAMVPSEYEVLTPELTAQLAYSVLSDEQRKRFETTKELDLSFGIKGLSRFRTNVFLQRGVISMAIRQIPFEILSFEELGLPTVVRDFTNRTKGLCLVTGPTGSGKSTTLAAMLDRINTYRPCHIITIEDPIEYIHHHKRALVSQREVGADTDTFPNALKYVLRQDPDVVLIGEMRDLETIQAALTIAETGHLTFATLHTNSCAQSIDRIIDVFPPHQQSQVRAQLALVLEAVFNQLLIPRRDGRGRALAMEILIATPAIRNMIREEKVHQIYSAMQAGQKFGMQTMNQSLANLYLRGAISRPEALSRSSYPDELLRMMDQPVATAAR